MLEFHGDMKGYFEMNINNTNKYVIPFIEEYKQINPGSRVLEIGCGEAGVLKAFIDKGCSCTGVELDDNRLVNAREWLAEDIAAGKVKLIARDIYEVNIDTEFGGRFDFIILKDVIEHIHDQERLIGWMKDFLNPGGVIFFGFPPWQMPYGGHQQLFRSKLSKVPYTHLLPRFMYRGLMKRNKEDIPAFLEMRDTGISIERFERIVKRTGYMVANKTHYLLNPIYEYKFGWKPRKQGWLMRHIPYLRNFFTTGVYYLITPDNQTK